MPKPDASLQLREAPKPLTSAEYKKRLDDLLASISSLRARPDAIRRERELRKKSDPDLTDAVLADFDRREEEATKAIARAEERAASLLVQHFNACDQEWLGRAQKARAEIEKLIGSSADAIYRKAHDLTIELGKVLSEIWRINAIPVAFNKVAGARLGFLELPENRIRHRQAAPGSFAAVRPKPLWEDLRRLPLVYPGDGYLQVDFPKNLIFEEAPPKPPADPAIAATAPSPGPRYAIPRSYTLPPPAEEPPAEERAPDLIAHDGKGNRLRTK